MEKIMKTVHCKKEKYDVCAEFLKKAEILLEKSG